MPSYLGTDISESKNQSKNNPNDPLPHLGQTGRFPQGHVLGQQPWVRHWRCYSCCKSTQICWELEFQWRAQGWVHKTLTRKKKISKEKEKSKEKPEEHPGITSASLFLQPNLGTQVRMQGGHTRCYLLRPLRLKDRHSLQPPAAPGWKKHWEEREVPFAGTEPPAPATDKAGPGGKRRLGPSHAR